MVQGGSKGLSAGGSEAPFDMQGLNAKQRKRHRRKLKKQKGKSVMVDKSPECGTSRVQSGVTIGARGVQALQPVPTSNAFALLRQEGAKGPLTGPVSQLSPIPEASEQAPTPVSSFQADVSRLQQVSFSFTPLNPARLMGPLELGTPPCTPPSDRASGDTREASPVVPGGPQRTGGRSYSDSDIPRAGQEADLGGFGFDTDQEPYPDHYFRPALILRDSVVKRGPPSAHHGSLHRIRVLLRSHSPLILCLLELFSSPDRLDNFKLRLNFDNAFCGLNNKLWLFWNNDLTVAVESELG
nr:uncharacterized protein LOC109181091 [Ipomoea batatas]